MGLIFLILGITLGAFSIQESHTEENTLDEWDDIGPSTIEPQTGPSWTLGMQNGSFFELNVLASGWVRVRIGTPVYDELNQISFLTNTIFDLVGTRFTQRVAVGEGGTYQVEIKNEWTTPVNISGRVFAKKIVTIWQTVYPYSLVGFANLWLGTLVMTIGVLTKPKKRFSRRKTRELGAKSI
jgi:hypothetical protein